MNSARLADRFPRTLSTGSRSSLTNQLFNSSEIDSSCYLPPRFRWSWCRCSHAHNCTQGAGTLTHTPGSSSPGLLLLGPGQHTAGGGQRTHANWPPKNGVASSGEIFPSSSLSSLSLTVHTHARKRGCFPGQILPPAGQGYPEYLRHRIASSCGNYDFIKLDPMERNKNRKWLATRLLRLRGSLFTHELASGSGTRSPERSPYVQPNNSQESSSKLLRHEKPLNRYTFYTKLLLLLLKNPATQLPVPAVGTEPATIPGRSLTHAHEMI